MISGEEIKILDKNSEFYGTSTSVLMENAGKSIADYIQNTIKPDNKNILILCGIGNNGGDGFVAARYLSKKYKVTILLIGKEEEIKTDISKINFKKLKKIEVEFLNINSIKNFDKILFKNQIIIDAMLGIGLTGTLREPYNRIVKKINSLKDITVLSVDVPTGLGTNIAVRPNYTITFHDVKKGMNGKNSGKIKKVDIKIPKKAEEYVGPGELSVLYPQPKKQSHKGDNGRVLVIGGGPFIGAPALAGIAALRTGVDLVFIVAPKRAAEAITSFSPLFIKPKKLAKNIACLSPNLIVKELTDEHKLVQIDVPIIADLILKAETVVIGPGLGSEKSTKDAIKNIISVCIKHKKSLVIDADAIQVIGENLDLIKKSQIVITPHAGEFKELTGIQLSNNIELTQKEVKKWAKKLNITILLKGPVDVISDGKNLKLNDVHNPAMTVGGTGDVLAGIVGALLAKNLTPFDAARIGVFINGTAGNYAFDKKSYGLIATDIIDEIPNVLNKYL